MYSTNNYCIWFIVENILTLIYYTTTYIYSIIMLIYTLLVYIYTRYDNKYEGWLIINTCINWYYFIQQIQWSDSCTAMSQTYINFYYTYNIVTIAYDIGKYSIFKYQYDIIMIYYYYTAMFNMLHQ